jgi:hypothetical protein
MRLASSHAQGQTAASHRSVAGRLESRGRFSLWPCRSSAVVGSRVLLPPFQAWYLMVSKLDTAAPNFEGMRTTRVASLRTVDDSSPGARAGDQVRPPRQSRFSR